jgi:hypothetical protein
MKNVIIVDIDTDREPVVQLGKPNASDLPKDKDSAKDMVAKDMACVTEALITLMQAAEESGYKSIDESIKDISTHIERAFSDDVPEKEIKVKNIKVDDGSNDEPKE